MQLSFSSVDIARPNEIEVYTRRVLSAALGHDARHVRSARVRIIDINGPARGGLDKRCWITLQLTAGPDVVAESIHSETEGAVSLGAAEVARLLARRAKHERPRKALASWSGLVLLALSACASSSSLPLVASKTADHAMTIDEAERLARALDEQRSLVAEADLGVLPSVSAARTAELEAYRQLASAESHLLTAALVDALAARLHDHAARAAPRDWYGSGTGSDARGLR